MELIKEIWERNLPNFGYVIEMDNGKRSVFVLGGQTSRCCGSYESVDFIFDVNEQMELLYEQTVLSDEDKKKLAMLMKRMQSLCESRREGLCTKEEQAAFIEKLSAGEQSQLEKQLQMYKDCRGFYSQYCR